MSLEEWSGLWLLRLVQNLLGYASIAVPGGLLVYFLKTTNFLAGRKEHCVWKYVNTFVHGNTESSQGNSHTSSNDIHETSVRKKTLLLMFCFAGLQLSYLTWGILQEKIMTQQYHNASGAINKFSDSQFLVFVNRVFAFIFSGIYILVFRQPYHKGPIYKYAYCSLSNIMSSWCQYEALKYVSFPTQVLAKASKIIPVMLMGKVVSHKVYKCHEYVTAGMISIGMVLFLWSQGDSMNARSSNITTASGFIILCAYMICDSFTSNWQGELFRQYSVTSMQMMCGVNFFSCMFTSISLMQLNGFTESLRFLMDFPDFFTDCVLLSFFSAVGQLFIFYTISKFGPVAFVIMMTIRQVLAILLSCLIYHHNLMITGIMGVVVVFSSVFLRIYFNYKSKQKKRVDEQPV